MSKVNMQAIKTVTLVKQSLRHTYLSAHLCYLLLLSIS